jgi:hypothetical protein
MTKKNKSYSKKKKKEGITFRKHIYMYNPLSELTLKCSVARIYVLDNSGGGDREKGAPRKTFSKAPSVVEVTKRVSCRLTNAIAGTCLTSHCINNRLVR